MRLFYKARNAIPTTALSAFKPAHEAGHIHFSLPCPHERIYMSKVDRPPPQTIRNGQTDGTDGGSPSLPSRPFHILNEATKKKCFGRESTERVVLRHWKTKGICPVVQMIKVKLFMVLKLHKKTFFCTDAMAIRSISFGRISEQRKHHEQLSD